METILLRERHKKRALLTPPPSPPPPPKTGAANIGDAGVKQVTRADKDLVPEQAVRPSGDNGDYHTGRGGAGNANVTKKPEDKAAEGGPAAPMSLADKLKLKILGVFKK